MKNDILKDDEVVFLYDQYLLKATVLRVNNKTFKLLVPAQKMWTSFEKLVSKERVANINDTFSIVWKSKQGVNGKYRIDYTTYVSENKTYQYWHQPYLYIVE